MDSRFTEFLKQSYGTHLRQVVELWLDEVFTRKALHEHENIHPFPIIKLRKAEVIAYWTEMARSRPINLEFFTDEPTLQ